MKALILAAVLASVLSCGKDDRNNVVPTPAAQAEKLLELPASARANYQIYQVNPKLYGNSGQLKAVQARLDDIKALGTDILYLMPIYPEGQKNGIGSPYCIKDYPGVRDACGTLADVKALVKAAHD